MLICAANLESVCFAGATSGLPLPAWGAAVGAAAEQRAPSSESCGAGPATGPLAVALGVADTEPPVWRRAAARGLHPCQSELVQLCAWSTPGFCQCWALMHPCPAVLRRGLVSNAGLTDHHQHLEALGVWQ